jgi:hypothetical protein
MEKPNYRLSEIETTEASGRVVLGVRLRKSNYCYEERSHTVRGNCNCDAMRSQMACHGHNSNNDSRRDTCDCKCEDKPEPCNPDWCPGFHDNPGCTEWGV